MEYTEEEEDPQEEEKGVFQRSKRQLAQILVWEKEGEETASL